MTVRRQHAERWLRATRSVVDGRADEVLATSNYRPDGPLATLANRLKVAPEFLFTWTQEKSYCAIRCQDQWFVIVDFAHLLPLLEMVAVVQLRDPNTAIAAILSREIAERFRFAGLVEEGISFAKWYREHRQDVARIHQQARGIRECSAILELYLGAHELAHVVFSEDPEFCAQMRAAVVNNVSSFVKSQFAVSPDPRDPELARLPADELAKARAGVQAGWLTAIGTDTALQEELAADDLARMVVLNSRMAGGHLLVAVTLFLIQLNLLVLNTLDVLVCGYQGGNHRLIRTTEPLLRSEYATLDLAYSGTGLDSTASPDIRQRLAEVGIMHKELFRRALYEHVIPQLSLLDSKRPSRGASVPAAQAGDRSALLDELLSL